MSAKKVSIIMYHYVRDLVNSRYPNIKGLDLKLFRQQIDFLSSKFYFLTSDELLAAVLENAEIPENSVWLTFDDGYIDHYTNVFPILKEHGIQGYFSMPAKILAEHKVLDVNKIHFILASESIEKLLPAVYERLDHYRGTEFPIPPTEELFQEFAKADRFDSAEVIFVKRLLQKGLPEKLRNRIANDLFVRCIAISEEVFSRELYMSMDQVRLMQREGMCFGIHGYDHYWLAQLSRQEVHDDIQKALEVFEGVVPGKWICCYPSGSCNDIVVEEARSMGAVAGLGVDCRVADLDRDDLFNLPRLDTNDFPPKSERYLTL